MTMQVSQINWYLCVQKKGQKQIIIFDRLKKKKDKEPAKGKTVENYLLNNNNNNINNT